MHLTTDVPAALLSSQPGLDAAPCRRSAATLDSGGNSAAQTPTQNTRGQAGSLSKPGQAFVDHVWGHAPMAAASQGSTQTGDRVLPLSQSGHTSQNSHGRPESQLGTANKRRYGSWYVPTENWQTVYQEGGLDRAQQAELIASLPPRSIAVASPNGDMPEGHLGLPSREELEVARALAARQSALTQELGGHYVVKVYKEHLRDNHMRTPEHLARLPDPRTSPGHGFHSRSPKPFSLSQSQTFATRAPSPFSAPPPRAGSPGAAAPPRNLRSREGQGQVMGGGAPGPPQGRVGTVARRASPGGGEGGGPLPIRARTTALETDIDDIMSPDLRAAVRKSLAMAEALLSHRSQMEQYAASRRRHLALMSALMAKGVTAQQVLAITGVAPAAPKAPSRPKTQPGSPTGRSRAGAGGAGGEGEEGDTSGPHSPNGGFNTQRSVHFPDNGVDGDDAGWGDSEDGVMERPHIEVPEDGEADGDIDLMAAAATISHSVPPSVLAKLLHQLESGIMLSPTAKSAPTRNQSPPRGAAGGGGGSGKQARGALSSPSRGRAGPLSAGSSFHALADMRPMSDPLASSFSLAPGSLAWSQPAPPIPGSKTAPSAVPAPYGPTAAAATDGGDLSSQALLVLDGNAPVTSQSVLPALTSRMQLRAVVERGARAEAEAGSGRHGCAPSQQLSPPHPGLQEAAAPLGVAVLSTLASAGVNTATTAASGAGRVTKPSVAPAAGPLSARGAAQGVDGGGVQGGGGGADRTAASKHPHHQPASAPGNKSLDKPPSLAHHDKQQPSGTSGDATPAVSTRKSPARSRPHNQAPAKLPGAPADAVNTGGHNARDPARSPSRRPPPHPNSAPGAHTHTLPQPPVSSTLPPHQQGGPSPVPSLTHLPPPPTNLSLDWLRGDRVPKDTHKPSLPDAARQAGTGRQGLTPLAACGKHPLSPLPHPQPQPQPQPLHPPRGGRLPHSAGRVQDGGRLAAPLPHPHPPAHGALQGAPARAGRPGPAYEAEMDDLMRLRHSAPGGSLPWESVIRTASKAGGGGGGAPSPQPLPTHNPLPPAFKPRLLGD